MKAFTELFAELDQTTSTNEKIHAITDFLKAQDAATNAWALFLLTGRRPKRLIGSGKLRAWAQELTGIPDWLVEECYSSVGDTAEMISLIVAASPEHHAQVVHDVENLTLAEWMNDRIFALAQQDEAEQQRQVIQWWKSLDQESIFILNKLLTGGLRVGVSETLVFRAIEKLTSFPRSVIASRMIGNWHVDAAFYERLLRAPDPNEVADKSVENGAVPHPFCLAGPLDGDAEKMQSDLGDITDWLLEWKWDGIRCQIVKTQTQIEIWSRGEERITESFPDLVHLAQKIEGEFILDGELLIGSWKNPQPFQDLQKRLNRKKPSVKLQTDLPVTYSAYDLLSLEGTDLTTLSLRERRNKLEKFMTPRLDERWGLSPDLKVGSWQEAEALKNKARGTGAEGLMVKSLAAPYQVGRKRGVWYKWKIDPLTVDAILTAAQPGTGRRASLYTDYTFSIWKGDLLVPIAKAYSGLTDEEIRSLDHWIRRNTVDRFGPVRTLKPERVFEIGCEGIAESQRHKSGYALRFPRILRERLDKPASEADHVETLAHLCEQLSNMSGLTKSTRTSRAHEGDASSQTSLPGLDEALPKERETSRKRTAQKKSTKQVAEHTK